MGKIKKNKNKETKNMKMKNKNKNTIKQETSVTPSFRDQIVCQVKEAKPIATPEELEFIRIASTQPLDLADFISKTNHGIKFKNLEQYEQFRNLMDKYNNVAVNLMAKTEVRGNELYELTIRTMLDGDDISKVERKILENKLPKQVER